MNQNKRRRLNTDVTEGFLKTCEYNFDTPDNKIAKNALINAGVLCATLNSDKTNKINHRFLNTLKPTKHKATNQQNSGRCWMFAGLNIFRILLMKALDIDNNFEFSETYLFFYDKLERSNKIIQYFIDNPDVDFNDREPDCLINILNSDGGWWNCFANLVQKYGLVPKEAMEETAISTYTSDMNEVLLEKQLSCINRIRKIKSISKKYELKELALTQIYNCLVKFLGKPPKQFDFSYTDSDGDNKIFTNLSPQLFYRLVTADVLKVEDFVQLTSLPLKYNKVYEIEHTNNVSDMATSSFINLPIEDLEKYVMKSINSKLPVWFAGDVNKGLDYYNSCLDEELFDNDLVFETFGSFNRTDKYIYKFTQGNHAMAILGYNVDEDDKLINTQVENSWGYYDNEVPGMDGFLTMSRHWFINNLSEIVIHKRLLKRTHFNLLKTKPVTLKLWDNMAPAYNTNIDLIRRQHLVWQSFKKTKK